MSSKSGLPVARQVAQERIHWKESRAPDMMAAAVTWRLLQSAI